MSSHNPYAEILIACQMWCDVPVQGQHGWGEAGGSGVQGYPWQLWELMEDQLHADLGRWALARYVGHKDEDLMNAISAYIGQLSATVTKILKVINF